MFSSVEDGINVLWCDDEPLIPWLVEALHAHRVFPAHLSTITEACYFLSRTTEPPAAAVPDVIITDLRFDNFDNSPYEYGTHLAAFADGLYRKRLGVPARIGVVSAFPPDIQRQAAAPSLVFTWAKDEILGDDCPRFAARLRIEAARFRRDRWCHRYAQEHPVQPAGSDAGLLRSPLSFGVVVAIDSAGLTLVTWDIGSVTSQTVRYVEKSIADRAGHFELHEPVRILEASGPVDSGNVTPGFSIRKLENLHDKSYIALRPDLDLWLTSDEKDARIVSTLRHEPA